jgi:nitric oxide reductase NorD protein
MYMVFARDASDLSQDSLVEPLSVLAGAIAGRPVAVRPGAMGGAWCDGKAIIVPDAPRDIVRDAVSVQAAILAVGGLVPTVTRRTTGRPQLRRRYLTLEALRAIAELNSTMPRSVARKVREVYDADAPTSPLDSFDRALSKEPIPEAPAWFGTLKPTRFRQDTGASETTAPSGSIPGRPVHFEPSEDPEHDGDSDRSRLLELLAAPVRSPVGDALMKLLGAKRVAGSSVGGGDGEEAGSVGGRVGRVGQRAHTTDTVLPDGLGLLAGPSEHVYPEWDHERGAYRPGYCSVFEDASYNWSGAHPLNAAADRRLLAQLSRLGLAYERHHRQAQGDTLDVTALIEHVVDERAGCASDPRVYEMKRRTAHDLGIVILLDVTGSTADADGNGRVFDDQREIASRLIAAFEALGDRVAAYGFRSYGRGGVWFLPLKKFDERYELEARKRMGALEPGGFTRLGAAIRHGTFIAEQSGTRNNLLILVGDGLPYDDGYELRYAEEDCRRALLEAVAQGVGCACVSVRTATSAATLHRVWGHVPCLQLEHPDDLGFKVLPFLRRSLREAAALGRDPRK